MRIAFRLGTLGCIGILAIGFTMVSPTRTTHANHCLFPQSRTVQVMLTRKEGPVTVDNTRSESQIRRLKSQDKSAAPLGNNWVTTGLVITEPKYLIQVFVDSIQLGPGSYCARLARVDALIGYDKFDIFITRDFRPGTCNYQSTLDHELTHVAVFKSGLNEYFPRMQRRLERTARNLGSIKSGNPEAAAKRLNKRLRDTIDPLFNEMNRTLDRRNALLDTPARYKQEYAHCNG